MTPPERSRHIWAVMETANMGVWFRLQQLKKSERIRARVAACSHLRAIATAVAGLVLAGALAGCVSKATAQAQARTAFLAGQQQAMERLQQNQTRGPTVTFIGEVKNNLIPWTADLTLAKAILAAGYYGPTDPKEIVVLRDGQQMPIDTKQLLNGKDILLLPGDVVEVKH